MFLLPKLKSETKMKSMDYLHSKPKEFNQEVYLLIAGSWAVFLFVAGYTFIAIS